MPNQSPNNRTRAGTRRRWLAGAAAGLSAFTNGDTFLPASAAVPAMGGIQRRQLLADFSCQYDSILGTSLELIVQAPGVQAARECEREVLLEIERLRRLLSTHDPGSEISRMPAGARVASAELSELISAYGLWAERTANAIHINMAGVIRLWQEAERTRRAPAEADLRDAFNAPWSPNVDALGKGFIIDRAVAVARRFAPAGLLDIGGDLRAWGDAGWPVCVADPSNPAENAPPLAHFTLREAAVATSGGYARNYLVAGRRHSHLIDPRSLQPVNVLAGATVIAPDALTANALSTAACVLDQPAAARLADAFGATGHLFTKPDRSVVRAGLLASAAAPVAAGAESRPATPAAPASPWPKGFRVTVNLSLKVPDGGRAKRPYVAVWIEDSTKKIVRTVAVWGTQPKYVPELSSWWRAAGGDRASGRNVTRATRVPGQYSLIWDGMDDAGKPLPKGDYSVCLEINREHGRHTLDKAAITCGDQKQSAALRASAESEASTVEYGPKPE